MSVFKSAGSDLEAVGDVPLGRLIAHYAEQNPDWPMLTVAERTFSRAEVERRSNRLARALAERGVVPGDFVTIALPNSIAHYETTYAVWKLGATPSIVSWRLPDNELRPIIRLVNPKLVVGCDASRVPGYPVLPADFEAEATLSSDPLPERVPKYWKAMTSGGSTGRPKVIVDHMPGLWNPQLSVANLPFGETVLNTGPLYHNAPFILMHFALFMGNHVVDLVKFDALRTLQLVETHRVSWLYLVPTMMHRIWRLPEAQRSAFDLSSLKTVIHMGAPCPIWLKEKWIEWLGPDRIYEGYGGTERQASTEITAVSYTHLTLPTNREV